MVREQLSGVGWNPGIKLRPFHLTPGAFPIVPSPQPREGVIHLPNDPNYSKWLHILMAQEEQIKRFKWYINYYVCILYKHTYKSVCKHCLKFFFALKESFNISWQERRAVLSEKGLITSTHVQTHINHILMRPQGSKQMKVWLKLVKSGVNTFWPPGITSLEISR